MATTASHLVSSFAQMKPMSKLPLCCLIGCLLLATGCSGDAGPTAHLAGTVTLRGKPLPPDAQAGISFQPATGEAVKVKIVDGKYDSPETPQGKVVVTFHISKPVGPVKTSPRTGKEYQNIVNIVPPRHAVGIPLEVTGDNLEQNFDL